MQRSERRIPFVQAIAFSLISIVCSAQAPNTSDLSTKVKTLATEIPNDFKPSIDTFDYSHREQMIPMRDGVKLYTVILVPKGAQHAPILITRTPYNAANLSSQSPSAHLSLAQQGTENMTDAIIQGGYIRVIQDIRGKNRSEGDFVMTRPLHGPQNPTSVDESTDAYDTIDWLVKHVPETNGKVGIIGTSYDGYLALMAMVQPHPALKVSVPLNPMVDGWMGDDWSHNGAFRQPNEEYIYTEESSRESSERWWTSQFDSYHTYLDAGSAGDLAKSHGLEQTGFWRKILDHPNYDEFWRDQAVDQILLNQPLKVPVMLVHSLWDQEDIYGAIAVYKAIKPKDINNDKVFLVIGPWHHGQELTDDGGSLGALTFDSATALFFRRQILLPFLNKYLKDDAAETAVSPVVAFQTGTNVWTQLPSWPGGCESNCRITNVPLYLGGGLTLSLGASPSTTDRVQYEEYISDPAKPVPFRRLPIPPSGYNGDSAGESWLVDDQRDVSTRPDVIAFSSPPLERSVKVSGQAMVNLIASTSGTDSDWVVKLIDVYPDEVADRPAMGGYELMVAADIFRGRYRESFEKPIPLSPDQPLSYRFPLPTMNHVFLRGHRIMVQVQSSWFPLYDRNPQTFVPNIFLAQPGDYQKANQRIYVSTGRQSFIDLPVVVSP